MCSIILILYFFLDFYGIFKGFWKIIGNLEYFDIEDISFEKFWRKISDNYRFSPEESSKGII